MQDIKITLIQSKLIWEDSKANLSMFNEKLKNIQEETNIIVLPETFTTGFSMNAKEQAVNMKSEPVAWMLEKSMEKNADIIGSMIIKEDKKYYNRLLWAKPDGTLLTYDKRHLFRMAGEEKVYAAGKKNITVKTQGWKIRPFICYDLRFPIWTRNMDKQYDISIFIANWPEKRSSHWKLLLQSRAIENQSYVIGVNRVGKDGKGISYSGDSSVIDPSGKIIFIKSYEEYIFTTTLAYSPLHNYRKNFPVWMDADKDIIKSKNSGDQN